MVSKHLIATFFCFTLSIQQVLSFVYMCWYVNSAENRKILPFDVEDIDASLCSHIIYSYTAIDPTNMDLVFFSNNTAIPRISEIVRLKDQNNNLKVLLSIGGWDVKSYGFDVVTNPANKNLVELFSFKLIHFLRKYDLDGVVIDYEFPNFIYEETENYTRTGYTTLLKTLREFIDEESVVSKREKLMLNAALAGRVDWIDSFYESSEIVQYIDLILLLSYDLRIFTERKTRIVSALYSLINETDFASTLNQVSAVEKWLSVGASTEQIVLGIPAYGRSYELLDANQNTVGAPIKGRGPVGNITQENGVLAYFEICEKLELNNSSYYWQVENMNPYLVYDNNYWVGYEDPTSVNEKMTFIKENNLGGAFLWTIDLDDFRGEFCENGKYPLLTTIKIALASPQAQRYENAAIMSRCCCYNSIIYLILLFIFIL